VRKNNLANQLPNFIEFYNNVFKSLGIYGQMERMQEDSPYHRENNVARHTDMVVMNLIQRLSSNSVDVKTSHSPTLALMAAAFHDVGKPHVKEDKFTEERGNYKSFAGHELRSARMWEDFYANHKDYLKSAFNISGVDAYVISVMIEHHRPWGTKNPKKLLNIFRSMLNNKNFLSYLDLLWADNMGRITDDKNNMKNVEEKIQHYILLSNDMDFPIVRSDNTITLSSAPTTDAPTLYVPVGTSGSGKSTFFDKELTTLDVVVHSMDQLRLELYSNDPAIAFKESCDDPEFSSKVMRDFVSKIKDGGSMYIDNTNLSAKRRRVYLTEADRRGYHTCAQLFRVPLDTLKSRRITRDDKQLPESSVVNQYYGLSYPLIGEFSTIVLK